MNVLALLTYPIQLRGQAFWAVIPVSIAVAIVYKTIRTQSLRRLPMEILFLSLYMMLGVGALMLVGWAFISWKG